MKFRRNFDQIGAATSALAVGACDRIGHSVLFVSIRIVIAADRLTVDDAEPSVVTEQATLLTLSGSLN